MQIWEFEAIGTHWIIDFLGGSVPDSLQERVLLRIGEFDSIYSRFISTSLVSDMSRKSGSYMLPVDAKALLDLYRELYEITDGAFTPLIGKVLSDAGYDATYSFKSHALTAPPAWDDVLAYDFPMLTLKAPALLDFGAAGKGYLVDIVAEMILAAGIHTFCINAGGDMRYENPTGDALRVALEHPDDTTKAIGIASISSGSICGSAGNRRTWGNEGLHHVISPHTLTSPAHIKAVWVTAPTAIVADALTTCLFFLSPDELLKRVRDVDPMKYSFEYLVLNDRYEFIASPGFPAELFTA